MSTRLPCTSNVSNKYGAQTVHTSARLTTNSEVPTTPFPQERDQPETRLTELKKTLYLADYKDTTQDQLNVRDAYSMGWSMGWGGTQASLTSSTQHIHVFTNSEALLMSLFKSFYRD